MSSVTKHRFRYSCDREAFMRALEQVGIKKVRRCDTSEYEYACYAPKEWAWLSDLVYADGAFVPFDINVSASSVGTHFLLRIVRHVQQDPAKVDAIEAICRLTRDGAGAHVERYLDSCEQDK